MKTYQRRSVWYVDYSFNGERIRYAVGKKSDAEEELSRIKYEVKYGIHRPQKKMVFDNLLEEYQQWAKVNKKESSLKRELTNAKPLLKYFGGRRMNLITHADAEQYQRQRVDGILTIEGVSKKPKVSNSTVNREVIMLKHMFKKAVEWGYLPINPLRNVKLLKEPPGRIRYVKPEEWQRLLSACSPEIRNLVIFARHTGLRRSEIFNLEWSDLDWEQKRLTIRERKNNTSMIIPMSRVVFKILTTIHKTTTSTYVFPGNDGQRRKTIQTGFKAACRRAGITDLRFHDLRHTFGSDLINSGADLQTVKLLMGHKNIASTVRYVHPTEEHLRKFIEAQDAIEDVTTSSQIDDDE
jgi:integrase